MLGGGGHEVSSRKSSRRSVALGFGNNHISWQKCVILPFSIVVANRGRRQWYKHIPKMLFSPLVIVMISHKPHFQIVVQLSGFTMFHSGTGQWKFWHDIISTKSQTVFQLSGFTVAANVDEFSQQPVLPQQPQVFIQCNLSLSRMRAKTLKYGFVSNAFRKYVLIIRPSLILAAFITCRSS